MNIAIDLRSLQSGQVSGVENYTASLVEQILKLDTNNNYTLFYNRIAPMTFEKFYFVNSRIVNFGLPNKVLNFGVRFLGRPKFQKYLGPQDIVFFPNFNFWSLEPEVKAIVTVHDLSPFIEPQYFNLKRRLWHKMINVKKILNQARAVVAVSEHTKKDIIRLFNIDPEKVLCIYPGKPERELTRLSLPRLREVRNRFNLPGEFILFIGTLEPRKNIIGLIESFEILESNVHLVIAGRLGWNYKEIFRKINTSRKRHKIHYLNYLPEEAKSYIIKLARLVVYPSFYEGFGLVPLEACALGVPVVVSSVSSLPEVVGDGCLLADPRDASGLAFAMSRVLEESELRQHLIKKGIKRAEKFSWKKAALQTLELFRTV